MSGSTSEVGRGAPEALAASPPDWSAAARRIAQHCHVLSQKLRAPDGWAAMQVTGVVLEVVGINVVARLPMARLGMLCAIETGAGATLMAEIVGFDAETVRLTAMGSLQSIGPGCRVRIIAREHRIHAGIWLCGDVLDAYGRSMTGKPGAFQMAYADRGQPVMSAGPSPLSRRPVDTPLATGIRVLDGLLTIGRGQRVGVFAGPGCGKTTLLTAIARGAAVDFVVFGLIGERGRELQEFVAHMSASPVGARTIIVAATSDRSSLERARAAFTATAIAESLCAQGARVLLLLDSLTRYARAQREIGMAAGEPPGRGGFPPSFYTSLPQLIERTGNFQAGSITSIYTVLSESDLEADPVADEARSLLDGHVVLSRKLGEAGHYPAVDLLRSLSRTMPAVVDPAQMQLARWLRHLMSRHEGLEFLIRVGEYQAGRDPQDDLAVNRHAPIQAFLQQNLDEYSDPIQTLTGLRSLASG